MFRHAAASTADNVHLLISANVQGCDPFDPKSVPPASVLTDLADLRFMLRHPGVTAPPNTLCEIVWPSGLTGVVLETTTHLAQPESWMAAPGGVTTAGDEQIYYHPAIQREPQCFFRLHAVP